MTGTTATPPRRLLREGALPLAGTGLVTFGYAVFTLGRTLAKPLQQAGDAGFYPMQELLLGIITDPLLFITLLLVRSLPLAWEIVPLVSSVRLLRAGSFSTVLRKVLLPRAFRQSVAAWLLVYAVAALVVAGGWLATGLLPAQASLSLVLLLSGQFARGVLVFVLVTTLLGLAAMVSPERFRQRTTAAASVLLWLALFVLSSAPDLVPARLNVITILSAGSEQSLVSIQLARPAQLSLALIASVACAGIVDVVMARARGRRLTMPSADLWLLLAAAGLVWALSAQVGPSLAEFYSGYRGTLLGAIAEATLTLGPAVFIWVVSGAGSARDWNTVVALRAGTSTAGLLAVLRSACVSALRLWGCAAIGTVLGALALSLGPWSDDSASESLIIGSALIGGLLQMLLYLVVLVTLSFLTSSQWLSIVSVILLAIVPPPGIRIEWLPLHAAFDSVLVREAPDRALRNTVTLALGLLVTVSIALGVVTLRDRFVGRSSSRK